MTITLTASNLQISEIHLNLGGLITEDSMPSFKGTSSLSVLIGTGTAQRN